MSSQLDGSRSWPNSLRFASGQKLFSRYTLKKHLGSGAMGVVWMARDEELDVDIALKFLPQLVALDRGGMGVVWQARDEQLDREVALNSCAIRGASRG